VSEIVERVAASIAVAAADATRDGPADPKDLEANITKLARAAIEAMREPTVVMVQSGAEAGVEQIYHKSDAWDRCVDPCNRSDWLNVIRFGWEAMIDEALE
jgi:hypothetical protein